MTKVAMTVLEITILHPVEDTPHVYDLEEIAREIDGGDWVGCVQPKVIGKVVPPEDVQQKLLDVGNDGTFFGEE